MDQHEECALVITDITNNDQNVGIQISDSSPLPLSLSPEYSSPSILVPGYLLVKSSGDSGTYQLQHTVIAIKMDNNDIDNNANANVPLTLPLEVITSEERSASGTNKHNNSNNNATIVPKEAGMTTRSKSKRSVITGISDGTDKIGNNCIIENRTHENNDTDCGGNDKSSDKSHDVEGSQNSENVNNKMKVKDYFTTKLTDDSGGCDMNIQIIKEPGKRVPPSRLVRVNCPVCSKDFKKTYLKEHMKIHEEEKPYKCTVCGKRYRWRTLLRNHKKTHLTNNPFTCPVCELRMSSKFSVQQHVLKVHENAEKKFQCSKCSKKYVTIHQLKAHEKFHSEDRTRQCEYCGKVYKHLASLERHRRMHKGEESSLDLRLKCSTCGLICHSKTHYTAHLRIHTGEKPFVCETCGKNYRQIAQLNQHKIVHTDLRPFKCTLCERTFRCRSNLQLHLDHHKGEKRHSCVHCGQKFFSYPNMLKHVRRNHLGLRPHKCQLCDKSFCEKQELQNHMRTHTGEKRPSPRRKRLPLPKPVHDKSREAKTYVSTSIPTSVTILNNDGIVITESVNECQVTSDGTSIYVINNWA